MAELAEVAEVSANNFALGDLDSGVTSLATMMHWLSTNGLDETIDQVFRRCIDGLQEFGASRKEYILLSLHTLDTAFGQLELS